MKHKVYAYITHDDRLLVFRQPNAPEAGIQVPGGTVEPDETSDAAVVREAFEETGLTTLRYEGYIGEHVWNDPRPQWRHDPHHRRFYHFTVTESPPVTWQHIEQTPSIGTDKPLFELFWVPLSEVPPLIAGMDYHLLTLRHLQTSPATIPAGSEDESL